MNQPGPELRRIACLLCTQCCYMCARIHYCYPLHHKYTRVRADYAFHHHQHHRSASSCVCVCVDSVPNNLYYCIQAHTHEHTHTHGEHLVSHKHFIRRYFLFTVSSSSRRRATPATITSVATVGHASSGMCECAYATVIACVYERACALV